MDIVGKSTKNMVGTMERSEMRSGQDSGDTQAPVLTQMHSVVLGKWLKKTITFSDVLKNNNI